MLGDPEVVKDIVGGLALIVLGGFLTALATKYRTRVTTLQYNIWHSFFGSTITDPHLGSLEVRFAGTKVDSLWYSTIRLANDSTHDVTDLTLDIACDSDSVLLTSRAVVGESLNDLALTPRYLAAAVDAKGNHLEVAFKRRDYHVPVINRGQVIEVYFLTANTKGAQPHLTVGCDHPGVRLRFALAKPQLMGEPQQESALLGSFLALLACWPLIVLVPSKPIAVLAGTILGILAMLLGIGARKVTRFLMRLIG